MPDKIHSDPEIVFDAATNSVVFKGEAGRQLLFAYLTKGKFGEPFDAFMLFNEGSLGFFLRFPRVVPPIYCHRRRRGHSQRRTFKLWPFGSFGMPMMLVGGARRD